MATNEVSILIVDNSADTTEMLSSLLSYSLNVEHVCHTAQSAEEALQQLESYFFHLVITDIEMPGMSGIELCQKIEQSQPNTLVMIVSGATDIHYAIAAMRSGAFDYILKPIEVQDFLNSVRRALTYQEALMKKHYCAQSLEEEFHHYFAISDQLRSTRRQQPSAARQSLRAQAGAR
jgi:two-component system response regulator YesN